MKAKNSFSKVLLMVIILSLLLLVVFSIFFVNINHYYYGINADIASEGVLAKLIWDTKEWIPSSWYASTEARIFTTPNLASLIYGIVDDMAVAMGIACSIFTLGILGSGWLFAKSMSFDRIQTVIFLILCMILPNNLMILEILYLHASYYAPHVIILFFTLSVYVSAIKGKWNYILSVFAVVLQIMYGTQGVRGILILSGPLFVIEIVHLIFCFYKKEGKSYDVKLLIWSFLLLIGGFIGGLFPYSVGQSFSRNIRKAPQKFLDVVFPDIMKSLGFQDSNKFEKVLLSLIVLFSVIMISKIIYKMFWKKKIETEDWATLVIFCSPIATALILTFTTIESSGRYYFVFIFAMAISIAKIWSGKKIWFKTVLISVIVIISICNYNKIYITMMRSGDLKQDDRYRVVEYLQEKEYFIAYSDFENANTMMLMSGGDITVGAIDDFSKMNGSKWLTSTLWYGPTIEKDTKTAYIVTETRRDSFLLFCEENNAKVMEEIKIGKYYIYGSNFNYTYIDSVKAN